MSTEPDSNECDCEFCRKSKRIDAVVASRDVDSLITLVRDLAMDWLNADQDRDYYRCILNGSWPTAREQLTDALAKVITNGVFNAPEPTSHP